MLLTKISRHHCTSHRDLSYPGSAANILHNQRHQTNSWQ